MKWLILFFLFIFTSCTSQCEPSKKQEDIKLEDIKIESKTISDFLATKKEKILPPKEVELKRGTSLKNIILEMYGRDKKSLNIRGDDYIFTDDIIFYPKDISDFLGYIRREYPLVDINIVKLPEYDRIYIKVKRN
jgi:hypothetical protein